MDKVLIYKILKNSYNSITKIQTIQFNNRQKNRIDIFPKKAYKWPTGP